MGRLVLIEGMIGAGKTTTAAHVARWLVGQGDDARAFDEGAPDHPIPTRVVDLLLGTIAETDPVREDRYAIDRWADLARRCRHGRQTVILESTFLQNSVLPRFLEDAPIDEVRALFARIAARMAPADPLLVYLRPSDTARAVERTHQERGDPWASRNLAAASDYPWTRARGLSGLEAIIALYRAWEPVVDDLLHGAPFEKLLLVDPQDDWDAALGRIYAALRGRKEAP